ncbi:MAG: glycosyltransferase family 4 protein [Thermoplasmata archaeon]|nr:glycosyltransferase family 4 protein [Thermoplasmata archaeon]
MTITGSREKDGSAKRALVLAYACEPGLGSENGVGWEWVKIISRRNETWVITRESNRPAIEAELPKNPLYNIHFIFFDYPKWSRFWKKGRRGIHLYYLLWQAAVFFIAKRLHKELKFDLAHHLTFVSDWMPSCLAFLPVPLIWGPVGSHNVPLKPFYGDPAALIYELARKILYTTAHYNPFVIFTRWKARKIIAINKCVARKFAGYSGKVITVPAIAVTIPGLEPRSRGSKTKILFAGSLVHWKGAIFAVEAYKRFASINENSELLIAGEGPCRGRIEDIIRQGRLQDKVKLLGLLPQQELFKLMDEADIFLYPSFEGAGMVVLEAMAHGDPVVCLDWGGPGEFVDERCGIKVKALARRDIIEGLSAALERLASCPDLAGSMGRSAREKAVLYSWEEKEKAINAVYG